MTVRSRNIDKKIFNYEVAYIMVFIMNFDILFLQLVFSAAIFFEHIWPVSSSDLPFYCHYSLRGQNRLIMPFRPKHVPGTELCTDVIMEIGEIQTDKIALNTLDGHVNDAMIKKLRQKFQGGLFASVERQPNAFLQITKSERNMGIFAQSAIEYLQKHSFDGLHIWWFRPGASQKTKFTKLLRILYEKLRGRKKKLLVLVNAFNVRTYYEPHLIHKYVDYLMVSSVDYGGSWNSKILPMTAIGDVHSTLHRWMQAGAPRNKLVVQIAPHGRTYKLRSSSQWYRGVYYSGPGAGGYSTQRKDGVLAHYEICGLLKKTHDPEPFNRVWNEMFQIPYIYGIREDQWEHIEYEDEESITRKAKLIDDEGWAGVWFKSLDRDDFQNKCENGTFPLLKAAKKVFGYHPASTNQIATTTYVPGVWITDKRTGKQYIVLETDDIKYDELQEICRQNDGFLPEPRDEEENKFLNDLGTNMFALGITDKREEGVWRYASDNVQVTWGSWIDWVGGDNEPIGGTDKNCALMLRNSDKWYEDAGRRPEGWFTYKCGSGNIWKDTSKSLICQKKPPTNWILDDNTGKRYTIVFTENSDKAFNAKKCRDHGGFLPEPRIYEENKFLNDLNTEMFFLGMTQSKVSGVWGWDSDKSPVMWFKWTPNDDDKPGEFCTVMLRNQNSRGQTLDSYWSDVKCASDSWLNGKKKSLICQKNETNWITDKTSGKEYLVMFTEDLKHDVNQQICNSIGGFLPEPKNKAENDFLNSLGTNTFLLGMSDKLNDGDWLWDSDQTPVKWASWMTWKDHPDEPNGDERENCAVMMRNEKDYSIYKGYRSDGWADKSCQSTTCLKIRPSSLICQKNKVRKTCAGKKETYWPEKKDCRKYYFCSENEETFPMLCPSNFNFNPKTNQCENQENYICYRDRIGLAVGDSGTVLKTTFALKFLTAMLTKVIAM